MIIAGAAIALVFAGGLLVFLWADAGALMRGTANTPRLMSMILVGPIVGLAPALLGLALARRGWRRFRGKLSPEDSAAGDDAAMGGGTGGGYVRDEQGL